LSCPHSTEIQSTQNQLSRHQIYMHIHKYCISSNSLSTVHTTPPSTLNINTIIYVYTTMANMGFLFISMSTYIPNSIWSQSILHYSSWTYPTRI